MSEYGSQELPIGRLRKPEASTRSTDDPGTASRDAAAAHPRAGDHDTFIEVIPAPYAARFELRRPIPVDFEEVAAGAVIARSEADLAVTGNDRQDAKTGLASWILDMFDDLAAADPAPSAELPPCNSAYWSGISSGMIADAPGSHRLP